MAPLFVDLNHQPLFPNLVGLCGHFRSLPEPLSKFKYLIQGTSIVILARLDVDEGILLGFDRLVRAITLYCVKVFLLLNWVSELTMINTRQGERWIE